MKTAHGILALSAAALFAIASAAPAFSEEIATTPDNTAASSPNTDESGKLLLGIDIANAGNTPEAVQNFIAGLTPEEQTGVRSSCAQVLSDGSAVGNLSVVQFCQNLQAG